LSTPQALQTFADWVASIRGEEASEAQTYVNRLLQAWGWADSVETGTIFERKIPKSSREGGMGKADALIEGTRADGHRKSPGVARASTGSGPAVHYLYRVECSPALTFIRSE
jgi:hypothetical protein